MSDFAYTEETCEHNFSWPDAGLEDMCCPHCGVGVRKLPHDHPYHRRNTSVANNKLREVQDLNERILKILEAVVGVK